MLNAALGNGSGSNGVTYVTMTCSRGHMSGSSKERSEVFQKKPPLLLPILGLMGPNSFVSVFIFFAKTKYASSASSCVSNVLSRFIHIFRYLSALTSLSAAYHSPEDRCRSDIARFLPLRPVTLETSRRQAVRISLYSSSSREELEELRSIFGRNEVRVSGLGRDCFFGSGAGLGAGFGSDFFFSGAALGSGAFFGGAAAFGVGGDFGRELVFFDEDDFSAFSVLEDLSDLSVLEDFSAFGGADDAVFTGAADLEVVLDVVGLDGDGGGLISGCALLALNCSRGLGHAPMGFGGSSTGGGAFLVLGVFAGVFGSGLGFDDAAATAFGGAPLLPVATGGGVGASAGKAASPKSCRARSFTLGNMVCVCMYV